MPNKVSADGLVTFNPTYHTYTHSTNGRLQGVTSLIDKYKNPFDSQAISLRESLRTGEPQQDILDRWAAKGKFSRELGTSCHAIAEQFIETNKLQITYSHPREHSMICFINDYFLTGRLKPLHSEYLVHNGKVASMIDTLAQSGTDQFILDYKSNDEIKMKGFKGQKMLAPFDRFEDCHYIHYSIQTSIYKRLYAHPTKDSYIIHLHDEGYKFIRCLDIPEVETII